MQALSPDQIAFFEREGYLIVEDVIGADDIAAVEAEYDAILDREIPRLVAAGRLADAMDGVPFAERYTRALAATDNMYDLYEHLDISLPLRADITAETGVNTGPAVFTRILRNPAILDIAETLLGPEVSSSPIQHTRIKPPRGRVAALKTDSNVTRTGWHQDEAVLTDEVDAVNMLTVWVAITDATEDNGCMVCVPRSHRAGLDLAMHCPGNAITTAEIFIPEAHIGDTVQPMPVRRGGVVLLNQRTKHGSLDNLSDTLRWSFDLRYTPTGMASGRSVFPDWVARSRSAPETEMRDPADYAAAWEAARARIVHANGGNVTFNARWKRYSSDPLCA